MRDCSSNLRRTGMSRWSARLSLVVLTMTTAGAAWLLQSLSPATEHVVVSGRTAAEETLQPSSGSPRQLAAPGSPSGTDTATTGDHRPPGLQCPPGDLVLERHDFLVAPSPDSPSATQNAKGYSSIEEALQRGVTDDYPYLRVSRLERVADADNSAQFIHAPGGPVLVSVAVSRYGEGWVVTHFEACNSVLIEGAGG